MDQICKVGCCKVGRCEPMKKYFKFFIVTSMILILTGCTNPFIEYKRPNNQLGSKWLSSDKSIELVIRSDYDHNSFCNISFDTGEKKSFYLSFDMGYGLELYDESVISADVIHGYDRYEHWNCSFIDKRKFVATVEKTTFFEVGQEITFYRVDPK